MKLNAGTVRKLISAAKRARQKAYAPYSKFPVGAAVLAGSGKVYGGCNVENASYGLTCCAERTAIFSAVANGEKRIRAISVVYDKSAYGSPCGACRQVIREFGKRLPVIQATLTGKYRLIELDELLPDSFGPEAL